MRPVPLPGYSHTEQPGSASVDFLSDSNFTELVVEVDYMPGYKPNEQALDTLKAFFEQRLHKNSVIIKEPVEVPSGGEAKYSADEVRALEAKYRSTFTEGETLAAYMIIVDGKYEGGNLLGIAYYNTSNAFFGPSYDEASGGTLQPSRYQIEAISFRHEFGHLFGLVGIIEMQAEHRDEQHGHHCDNEECLMYYATQTTDIGYIAGEGISYLDANCIADLRAEGGK
ncbi:MAG TPA: hypothetical protein VF181_02490 [Balneolaceae bacterium]